MTHEDFVHLQVIALVMGGVQLPPMFQAPNPTTPAGFAYLSMVMRVVEELAAVVEYSHRHGGMK